MGKSTTNNIEETVGIENAKTDGEEIDLKFSGKGVELEGRFGHIDRKLVEYLNVEALIKCVIDVTFSIKSIVILKVG